MGVVDRIVGIEARSTDALTTAMVDLVGRRLDDSVVVDLSVGSRRGHHVAAESSAQLGLAPPGPIADAAEPGEPTPSYADLIGWGIDAESEGNPIRRVVVECADRVGAALDEQRRALVVVTPRTGFAWEPEDVTFIGLVLRRTTVATPVVLAGTGPHGVAHEPFDGVPWQVSAEGDGPGRAGGLAGLWPGLVDDADLAVLGGTDARACTPLGGGRLLVPLELRRDRADISRLEWDRLAVSCSADDVRAVAQQHGNALFVDAHHVIAQAWQRFREGGVSLALRLLELARSVASTPVERAALACQVQGMRLAAGRFAEAAGEPLPSAATPADLRRFLLFTTGYASVMRADPAVGMGLLEDAERLADVRPDDRELLYLRNVKALALLKLGDHDGAVRVERDIRRCCIASQVTDRRLRYVNSINLARLTMRAGDGAGAERLYGEAFAHYAGVRSEGETIYLDVTTARLAASRGDGCAARTAWLRAALLWLAAEAPEAVGSRLVGALLGRSLDDTDDVAEICAEAIAVELGHFGRPACGLAPPVFANAGWLAGTATSSSAVGGPGWGVLTAAGPPPDRVRDRTPAVVALRGLVAGVLTGLDPTLARAGLVIVDDRLGRGVARHVGELTESALRCGASGLRYAERDHGWDAERVGELERSLEVGWAECVVDVVDHGTAIEVVLARGPAQLHSATEVLRHMIRRGTDGEPTSVATMAARLGRTDVLGELRELERRRVVRLSCPETG